MVESDAPVLFAAVVLISALAVCVFRRSAPAGVEIDIDGYEGGGDARVAPAEGDTVAYGEFSNDGSLWRARVYAFATGRWEPVGECYPSTGSGCGPAWREVRYAPAASVAGLQRVEIDSDRHGFLRHLHPKSRFVDDAVLWAGVTETAR